MCVFTVPQAQASRNLAQWLFRKHADKQTENMTFLRDVIKIN